MSLTRLSRRHIRYVITVLSISVVLLFVSINVLYMILSSKPSTTSVDLHGKSNSLSNHLSVEISDIHADVDGRVNIGLSLKIQELLQFLEGDQNPNGEATSNPIPRHVNILINNPNICEKSRDLKYIIYVHSSPGNSEKRDILRSTWANKNLFNNGMIERIFLMGLTDNTRVQARLIAESDKYHDIIQGDFIDNYRNLTLKGLMGLQWVSTYCKKAQYAIKADDDAFVDIFKFTEVLQRHQNESRVLACPLWADNSMPILRDPAKCAKWCVRFNEFPGKRYFPQYCAGLTFALSNDLVSILYELSKKTPFFWIDDVYITGVLIKKVKNIEFIQLIRNFTLKQDEALKELENPKQPYSRLFVHAKKPDMFKTMWKLLLSRLAAGDLKRLSTDFIEQNEVLKKKLPTHHIR